MGRERVVERLHDLPLCPLKKLNIKSRKGKLLNLKILFLLVKKNVGKKNMFMKPDTRGKRKSG